MVWRSAYLTVVHTCLYVGVILFPEIGADIAIIRKEMHKHSYLTEKV
jgi:hypothetical protein